MLIRSVEYPREESARPRGPIYPETRAFDELGERFGPLRATRWFRPRRVSEARGLLCV